MALFLVTTTIPTERHIAVVFPFEADGCEDLHALYEALAKTGCVYGWRYRVERDKSLSGRRPVILSLAGIATITDYGSQESAGPLPSRPRHIVGTSR